MKQVKTLSQACLIKAFGSTSAEDSQHDTSEELRLIDEHGQECPFYADMIGTTGEAFPVWLGYLPYVPWREPFYVLRKVTCWHQREAMSFKTFSQGMVFSCWILVIHVQWLARHPQYVVRQ